MPSPLRRSGSGLLQNPWPGLLPSPCKPRLGPLGPLRVGFSTRQSSRSLRPAASLLLASTPGSRRTPEVDYRGPLAASPSGTHTRRLIGPLLGTRSQNRRTDLAQNGGADQRGDGVRRGGQPMGEMAVERWLGRLLVEEAGFTLEEASAAAKANARFLDRFSLVSAISTAVVARATPRLPGGREWWMKQGERARHAVLDGNVGEAEAQVAELLAE